MVSLPPPVGIASRAFITRLSIAFSSSLLSAWVSQMRAPSAVRRARAISRKLKSLFISGKSEPSWDSAEQDDFVSKPFRNSELIGCVWELLTRGIFDENEGGDQAELGILEAKLHCLTQLRDKAIASRDVTATKAAELNIGRAKSEWARLTGNRRRMAH
jgi:hypothetical protein